MFLYVGIPHLRYEAHDAVRHIVKAFQVLRALCRHFASVNLAFHNDVAQPRIENLDIGSSLWLRMLNLNCRGQIVGIRILHADTDAAEECEERCSLFGQHIAELSQILSRSSGEI
jgi:hypothetical protein